MDEKLEFYDIETFNHDEFDLVKKGYGDDFYFFSELWFRLQVNQVFHERVESQLDYAVLAPLVSVWSIILYCQK